jgi:hypothetical protein
MIWRISVELPGKACSTPATEVLVAAWMLKLACWVTVELEMTDELE